MPYYYAFLNDIDVCDTIFESNVERTESNLLALSESDYQNKTTLTCAWTGSEWNCPPDLDHRWNGSEWIHKDTFYVPSDDQTYINNLGPTVIADEGIDISTEEGLELAKTRVKAKFLELKGYEFKG